jgi:hypothetical protein
MWRTAQGDERMLIDYLLGNLPEPKQEEVEDRAFADRSYLAAIQAAEADLIDAYVRGDLSDPERRQFELRFFASPVRRKKVEFARTLAKIAGEEARIKAEARPSLWRRMLPWDRPLHFAAAMGALLCAAAVSWLTVENRAMRTQVADLQSRGSELKRQTTSLSAQLAEERARSAKVAAQPKPTIPQALVASLILARGTSRSQDVPSQLVLTPGAKLVQIEVQLEPRDDFPRFRGELRTSGGDEVLTRAGLRPRRASGGFTVSVDIPASALPPGQYELALKGVTASGSERDVGYYQFGVKRY